MAANNKITSIVKFSSIQTAEKPSSALDYTNLETYSIVWLDPLATESKEYLEAQQRLRTSINYLKVFKTMDECEQYLPLVPGEDRIFFLVNNHLGQEFVPRIHSLRQIFAIYIYHDNQKRNGQWTKEYPKVKGVSAQLDLLVNQIKAERIRRNENRVDEPVTIDVFHRDLAFEMNDPFIRSHLLVDCLLGMKETSADRTKLVQLCEEHYRENKTELVVLREFQSNYLSNRSIRWFTRHAFLYRMLSKALRTQNIDLLFLLRFFIQDLQEQLTKNQYSQPIRLYRAQLISDAQMQTFRQAVGGFLMINTFLSATIDRQVSLAHLDRMDKSDRFERQRVLFEIDADPRLEGMKPLANIIWLSYCFGQQEVLMMVGSIFRLLEIEEGREITVIRLALCSDQDQELSETFEHLRKTYQLKDLNLLSFSRILSDVTNFNDAKQFYLHLLNDLPSDHQHAARYYHALGNVAADKGDYDLSLEWYEKLRDVFDRTLAPDDGRLADSHCIIAEIYWKKNDLKHALESYQKALSIYKQALDENHLTIAHCSEKIGTLYEKDKKFFQALNHYEKALLVRQKSLPANHLDLAMTHSKLAGVRLSLCHYYLALGHYNIALTMKQSSLPAEHLDIASDYLGMAQLYKAKGELHQALVYYEKVMNIYRTLLPSDHPDSIEMERTIRFLSAQAK